ncbi:MAG: tetratricopeptide repeat protein [Candidatus Thermoplasmatota archaeon]
MDTNFTAKEKILVHLFNYYGKNEGYTLPVAITQEGIAEKVGLKQNTVSYAVRTLVEEGLVEEQTRRIKNKKQKRKAYFLTEEGVDKAEEVRDELADTQVKVELNDEEKLVRVEELNAYLNTNLSFTKVLKKVEQDGCIKEEGMEGGRAPISYLYHMPKPLNRSISKVDALSNWYDEAIEERGRTACITGEDGLGKTTVLTGFADRMEGKTNVFYFKVKGWHSQMHFWMNLTRFLEQAGRYRLSSYIRAPDQIERKEILTNLRRDLDSPPSLLLIDDIHLNEKIEGLIKTLSESEELNSLRIVVSSSKDLTEKGWSFEENQEFTLDQENSIQQEFKEFYGFIEGPDPIASVLNNHVTREEFDILAFLSILRKPIRKKELCRLEDVNENIVSSLLNTPLLHLTVENKPLIQPMIERRVLEILDEDKKEELHREAYQHYVDHPLSEEFDAVEELYHIAKIPDTELFEERIEKTGERILSSGFADSLLEIIGDYEDQIEEEDSELPFFITFLRAEGCRKVDKTSHAVEKYRGAIDSSSDPTIEIKAYQGIATIREEEDKLSDAISEYQKSIEVGDEADLDRENKKLIGISRIRLGSLLNEKGEYQKAKDNLNEAIDILEKDDHSLLTSAYFMLARIEKSEGNWEKAVDNFDSGLKCWENIDETYQRVGGLKEIGSLYTIMRELDNAEEHLREAVQTSERFGYWHLKSSALLSLAECYIERRMFDKAIEVAEEAKELLDDLGDEEEKALAHSLLGKAYNRNSQEKEAEKELTKAISIYQRLGSSYRLGLAYFSMAKLQEKLGDKKRLAQNYRKAILSFSGSGANWMAEKVEKEMDNIPISM